MRKHYHHHDRVMAAIFSAASVAALAPVSGLSVPQVVSITRPVYSGITYTPVNKWDTLPLLQLQGNNFSV